MKKVFATLLLLCVTLLCSAQFDFTDLVLQKSTGGGDITTGLQLDLWFDGNTTDHSANAYSTGGTLSAYGISQNGTANFAGSFSSTFVTVGSTGPNLFDYTTQDFSDTFFIKLTSMAANCVPFVNGNGYQNNGYFCQINTDGSIHMVSNQPAAAEDASTAASAYPNDGNYHFVAITRTGSTIKIYVDAVSRTVTVSGTGIIWLNPASATAFPFAIGEYTPGGSSPVPGLIDTFRVYNRTLSQADISLGNSTGAKGP